MSNINNNSEKKPTPIKPTEGELEILQVIWDKGQATVREVHEALNEQKDVGYTTTLKLMQIMFEKGLVKRNEESKTHVYESNVTREQTQKQMLGKFIRNLYSGKPAQLVMQALGSGKASKKELDEIQQLLNKLKK